MPATAKISADVQQSFVVRSAVKEPVFKLAGESVSSYRKQVCRTLKSFTMKKMKRGYLTCSFDSKSITCITPYRFNRQIDSLKDNKLYITHFACQT